MSVLKNVKIESDGKAFKEKDYLGAKADFPINVTREFRILRGNPSRSMFITKTTGCRSFDGIVGKIIESGYKEERDCDDCNYRFGFTTDKGDKVKCKSQYTLYFEHNNPEKEYVLTISYGAQKSLDNYVKKLAAAGLDVDQVVTGITRIENPNGPGTTYKFEKIRDLSLDLSNEEEAALSMLKSKAIATGNPIPVKLAADILKNMASLAGISDEKALRLAESIAVDGMITGKSN